MNLRIFLSFPIVLASLQAATVDDLTLQLVENEYTITNCSGSASGELIIPDSYNGYPITSVGDAAFQRKYNLERVVLPSGIKTIGHRAFQYSGSSNYNGKLRSVVLPEGLISIGTYAFSHNKDLTINLPNSIESIGSSAFYFSQNITIDKLPSSLNNLGSSAFKWCDLDLETLEIPPGITIIPSSCFEYAHFSTLILPDSLERIESDAFNRCDNFSSVTIPSSVVYLGSNIFEDCALLTEVYFKGNVPAYSNDTFNYANGPNPILFYSSYQPNWEAHATGLGAPTIFLNPPVISSQPSNILASIGDNVSFQVVVNQTTSNISYQWMKNGIDLIGKTNHVLLIDNINQNDEGSYTVRIENSNGSTYSSSATLEISSVGIYTESEYQQSYNYGYSSGINFVLSQSETFNLYSLTDIADLRPGSSMIEVSGNQATVQLQMEESSDLQTWEDAGDPATMTIPADTDTKFFRFKMAD